MDGLVHPKFRHCRLVFTCSHGANPPPVGVVSSLEADFIGPGIGGYVTGGSVFVDQIIFAVTGTGAEPAIGLRIHG